MAQTKRKRQTKHRGNAAGVVQSRGRTSKPVPASERKAAERQAARQERQMKRPTWKSAAQKSLLAGAFMFVFLMLLAHPSGGGSRLVAAIIPALLAVCLYLPASFYLETYLWRRRTGQLPTRGGGTGMFGGWGRKK